MCKLLWLKLKKDRALFVYVANHARILKVDVQACVNVSNRASFCCNRPSRDRARFCWLTPYFMQTFVVLVVIMQARFIFVG